MAKVLINNKIMIETNDVSWTTLDGKIIWFGFKNISESKKAYFATEKEADMIYQHLMVFMEVPKENMIEVNICDICNR